MTIEAVMEKCSDKSTTLGQTLAYAWSKYQKAKTSEERGDILDQVVWAIEEEGGYGHLVH